MVRFCFVADPAQALAQKVPSLRAVGEFQCFAIGHQRFAINQTCSGSIAQPAVKISQEIQNLGSGGT
ncbi:MAG: hypothetical protein ACI87O_002819, partial [Planctomycetota bacterium]